VAKNILSYIANIIFLVQSIVMVVDWAWGTILFGFKKYKKYINIFVGGKKL
jgi:hypothetical protein